MNNKLKDGRRRYTKLRPDGKSSACLVFDELQDFIMPKETQNVNIHLGQCVCECSHEDIAKKIINEIQEGSKRGLLDIGR